MSRKDWIALAIIMGIAFVFAMSAMFNAPKAHAGMFGGGSSHMAVAKKWNGTNPTGWSRNWCAKYVDMVLRKSGKRGGGNSSAGYRNYGRKSGCRVGAIAVMRGHIGFVTACHGGSVSVLSGNHAGKSGRRTVGPGRYKRSRIVAFRMP